MRVDVERLLVIDSCGAVSSVALAVDGDVVCVKRIAERMASAELLHSIEDALREVGWTRGALHAVGVVAGPGSFTGVRVGLAAAKGLCEGLGVPMAAVSRLEVLFEAAGDGGAVVALDAGRGELFVRGADGEERLVRAEDLSVARVVVCEEKLAAVIVGARLVVIDAASALGAVRRVLAASGSDVARMDANYVRGEGEMYRTKARA